jgi:hypothetical protein
MVGYDKSRATRSKESLTKDIAAAELGLAVSREAANTAGDLLIELGNSLKSGAETMEISAPQYRALDSAISKLIADTREALRRLEALRAQKEHLGL